MNLRESSRIKKIFEEAERLIQVGTHELTEDIGVQKMGPLLRTLKEMEKICTASNVYNRAGYSTEQVSQSLVSKSVYFRYSNAEENWLTKQMERFEVSPKVIHSLIKGVLIQSCSAGAKNFTNYVFCHVQFNSPGQSTTNLCAIKAKF